MPIIARRSQSVDGNEQEAAEYAAALLRILKQDELSDEQIASQVYEIHIKLRTNHALYIAVCGAIGAWFARWTREYVREAENPGWLERERRRRLQERADRDSDV